MAGFVHLHSSGHLSKHDGDGFHGDDDKVTSGVHGERNACSNVVR